MSYYDSFEETMSPYTDFLWKEFEKFPDIYIDPSGLFEWKIWSDSKSQILGKVSIRSIQGAGTNKTKESFEYLSNKCKICFACMASLSNKSGLEEAPITPQIKIGVISADQC